MAKLVVADTSFLVAIARNEPEAPIFIRVLGEVVDIAIPASVYLEFAMVARGAQPGREWLDEFIRSWQATIMPITEATARRAADAFARYGRGSGHPAGLNFGDCLSYAVAIELDAPLLFKGADFAHTDVKRAI